LLIHFVLVGAFQLICMPIDPSITYVCCFQLISLLAWWRFDLNPWKLILSRANIKYSIDLLLFN
jgi:hypothetical protein